MLSMNIVQMKKKPPDLLTTPPGEWRTIIPAAIRPPSNVMSTPKPTGQQERSAQPHDEDDDRNGVLNGALMLPEDVVGQMKGDEQKR